MEITKEWLKEKEACSKGFEWYLNQSDTDLYKLVDKLMQERRKAWANWLITRAMNRTQQLEYAIASAELVLPIFETKYPLDCRPRAAIEAAKAVLEEDSQENRDTAHAARLASRASRAAAWAAADAARAVREAVGEAVDWEQIFQIGIKILKGKN